MLGKDVSLGIRAAEMAPSGDTSSAKAVRIAPGVLVQHTGHASAQGGAGAERPNMRKNNRTGR